jgi:Protein of unknown function (DUF3096)
MDAGPLTTSTLEPIQPIHRARHRSKKAQPHTWQFSAFFMCAGTVPSARASPIVEPRGAIKRRSRFEFSSNPSRRNFMTITTAHIPAIVALIAGILILIMPRLLNLVVAIYLICVGLIGLGLLKWLHL